MSQFEYITVLTSFVVAVGVSQLISGWGRLYLNRATAPPYPLQIVASALLLIGLLQSLWGYWGFRDVSWDFGRFLVVLAPLLPLVGGGLMVTSGIASVDDVAKLAALEPRGLQACVIGMAFYEGKIQIREAIEVAKKAG